MCLNCYSHQLRSLECDCWWEIAGEWERMWARGWDTDPVTSQISTLVGWRMTPALSPPLLDKNSGNHRHGSYVWLAVCVDPEYATTACGQAHNWHRQVLNELTPFIYLATSLPTHWVQLIILLTLPYVFMSYIVGWIMVKVMGGPLRIRSFVFFTGKSWYAWG